MSVLFSFLFLKQTGKREGVGGGELGRSHLRSLGEEVKMNVRDLRGLRRRLEKICTEFVKETERHSVLWFLF